MIKLQTMRGKRSTIITHNQKPHQRGLKALTMAGDHQKQGNNNPFGDGGFLCASGTHTEVSRLRHFTWLLGNKGPAIL